MKKQSKTILLIEDNTDILEAVTLLLEDQGYKVVAAENEQFIEKLHENNIPDIILLDMLLSGIDGREIIVMLKNKKITQNIPIILTSAHPNAKNIWKQSGANDFLPKPFSIEALREIINKNLSSK